MIFNIKNESNIAYVYMDYRKKPMNIIDDYFIDELKKIADSAMEETPSIEKCIVLQRTKCMGQIQDPVAHHSGREQDSDRQRRVI